MADSFGALPGFVAGRRGSRIVALQGALSIPSEPRRRAPQSSYQGGKDRWSWLAGPTLRHARATPDRTITTPSRPHATSRPQVHPPSTPKLPKPTAMKARPNHVRSEMYRRRYSMKPCHFPLGRWPVTLDEYHGSEARLSGRLWPHKPPAGRLSVERRRPQRTPTCTLAVWWDNSPSHADHR